MLPPVSEFSLLRQRAGISISDLSAQSGLPARQLDYWENGQGQPLKAVVHLLTRLVQTERKLPTLESAFTFIDLFAGIGGLRRGFEPLGGRCVFTSEWDEYAKKTYLANYKCDHDIAGDITKIDAGEIPKHDVLLAGFPCQPFSIAGVSKKKS
jgi:DNA (cytosine-5)-methyltransferase 1